MPITPTITKTQNVVVRAYKAYAVRARFASIDRIYHNTTLSPTGNDLYPCVYAEIESATSTITQTISFPANQNINIPLYPHGNPTPVVNGSTVVQPYDMSFRLYQGGQYLPTDDYLLSVNDGTGNDIDKLFQYYDPVQTVTNNGPLYVQVVPDFQPLPAITSVNWTVSNPAKLEIVPASYYAPAQEGSSFKYKIMPKTGVLFTPNEYIGTVQGTIVVAGQTLLTNVVNVYAPASGVIVGVQNTVTRVNSLPAGVTLQNVQYSLDNATWLTFTGSIQVLDNSTLYLRATFVNASQSRMSCEIVTPTNHPIRLVNKGTSWTMNTSHVVTDGCTITFMASAV